MYELTTKLQIYRTIVLNEHNCRGQRGPGPRGVLLTQALEPDRTGPAESSRIKRITKRRTPSRRR